MRRIIARNVFDNIHTHTNSRNFREKVPPFFWSRTDIVQSLREVEVDRILYCARASIITHIETLCSFVCRRGRGWIFADRDSELERENLIRVRGNLKLEIAREFVVVFGRVGAHRLMCLFKKYFKERSLCFVLRLNVKKGHLFE